MALLLYAYKTLPVLVHINSCFGLFNNFYINHAIIRHLPKNSYQICLVVAFLLTLQKDSY